MGNVLKISESVGKSIKKAAACLRYKSNQKYHTNYCASYGSASDGVLNSRAYYMDSTHEAECFVYITKHAKADIIYHFAKWQVASSEVYDEYMKWILNYDLGHPSPWRSLWEGDDNHLAWPKEIKIGRSDIRSFDFIVNHGFIFPTLRVPGNLLGSFLTVYRYYWEFPDKINFWYALTKSGVSPAFAFMFTGILDEKGVVCPNYNSNHWFLDTETFDVKNYNNFVSGNPVSKANIDFSESCSYMGIMNLWGDGNRLTNLSTLLQFKVPKTKRKTIWNSLQDVYERVEDPIKFAVEFEKELMV